MKTERCYTGRYMMNINGEHIFISKGSDGWYTDPYFGDNSMISEALDDIRESYPTKKELLVALDSALCYAARIS